MKKLFSFIFGLMLLVNFSCDSSDDTPTGPPPPPPWLVVKLQKFMIGKVLSLKHH